MTPATLTEALAWLDEAQAYYTRHPSNGSAYGAWLKAGSPDRFITFVASRVAECLRGHLAPAVVDPLRAEIDKALDPVGLDPQILVQCHDMAVAAWSGGGEWDGKWGAEIARRLNRLEKIEASPGTAPAQAEGEPLSVPGPCEICHKPFPWDIKGKGDTCKNHPAPVPEVSPAPTWTREKPKVEGWYWHRTMPGYVHEPLAVLFDKGVLRYWNIVEECFYDLPPGQWSGPIPEPIPTPTDPANKEKP